MKGIGKFLVMSVLMLIAIVGIFGEPNEEANFMEFMFNLVTLKLVGIGAGIAAYRLGGKYVQGAIKSADHE